MQVMFEKLMGKIMMRKYKVLSDQLLVGGDELYDQRFVNNLIRNTGSDHYIYITERKVDSRLTKARFVVFETLGCKTMFMCDNYMVGNPLIYEVGLSYMN